MASTPPTAPHAPDDYAAEEDHRTLTRAEEVRGDPKRMAGVGRHHRKVTRALGRVGRALNLPSKMTGGASGGSAGGGGGTASSGMIGRPGGVKRSSGKRRA